MLTESRNDGHVGNSIPPKTMFCEGGGGGYKKLAELAEDQTKTDGILGKLTSDGTLGRSSSPLGSTELKN